MIVWLFISFSKRESLGDIEGLTPEDDTTHTLSIEIQTISG